MASAAAAQWQPTAVARASGATADPAADEGADPNQTLTQVPLKQRLPHIRRRKPSAPPKRQPAAAAANMVSETAQPPCPVAAPPESRAAASTEQLAACLPRPSLVMQHRQPQPQQADIPRPTGPATALGTLAQMPLLPLQQQQQQQSVVAPPVQTSSACTGVATCRAAGASAACMQALPIQLRQQQQHLRASDTEDTLSLTERIKQRRQALAARGPVAAATPPGLSAAAAVHSQDSTQPVLPQLPAPQAHGGHADDIWHQDGASGFSPISPPAAAAPPTALHPGEADNNPHGETPLSQVHSVHSSVAPSEATRARCADAWSAWSDMHSNVAQCSSSWSLAAVWHFHIRNVMWRHDAGDAGRPPESAQAPVHHAHHPTDCRRESGRAARQRQCMGVFPAGSSKGGRRLFSGSAAWRSSCGISANGAAQWPAPAEPCCGASRLRLPDARR
jgi:hypothetical protein